MEVSASSSSTNVLVPPPNPAPQLPVESEDPTLGKRKASQITADPGATSSVTQKRKKRRKVGPDQSTSAADNSTVEAALPEPQAERTTVPVDAIHDVAGPSVVVSVNQGLASQTQKKKKKKKAGAGQNIPMPTDPVGQDVELPVEPAGPSKIGKRKTVVLDLSTVIPPPAVAQVRLGPSVYGIIDLWVAACKGLSVYVYSSTTSTCCRTFAFYDKTGYQEASRKAKAQSPNRAFWAGSHYPPCSSPEPCRRTCLVQHETETARQ